MSEDPLALVRWIALAGVLVRHMVGAARAFVPVAGERRSWLTQVIGVAFLVVMIDVSRTPPVAWRIALGLVVLRASLALFAWAKRARRHRAPRRRRLAPTHR